MTKMQLSDGQYLPAKWAVCGRCRGEGKHTNPAIDGNGITESDREDWADDEFMTDYLRGVYDVPCEQCAGERVVLVPDEERATPQQLAAWQAEQDELAEMRAMEAAERRAGA